MLSEIYACIDTEYISVLVLRYDMVLTSTFMYIYLSKVLTERFSIQYQTQTKEDIRIYILTFVLVDINLTFSAKVWIQL